MITLINGSLLDAKENILCHQVNCLGIMGAGLAFDIRMRYPEVYTAYREYCKLSNYSSTMLGKVQLVDIGNGKYFANIFGQVVIGRGARQTDYDALDRAFLSLKCTAKDRKLTVAIPYGIGCGHAGGVWRTVSRIIEIAFKDYEATIYKLQT